MQRSVRDWQGEDGEWLRAQERVIDARGAHAGDPNAVALRAYWNCTSSQSRRASLDGADSHRRRLSPGIRLDLPGVERLHERALQRRRRDALGRHPAGPPRRDYFDSFASVNSILRRLHAAMMHTEKPVGYHVAWANRNPVVTARVLRIGDAANLADPLTGDGIGNALNSGRLVADAIGGAAAARGTSEAAAAWQRLYSRKLSTELRAALALRQSLVTTRAKNLANRWVLAPLPRVRAQASWIDLRRDGAIATSRPSRAERAGATGSDSISCASPPACAGFAQQSNLFPRAARPPPRR